MCLLFRRQFGAYSWGKPEGRALRHSSEQLHNTLSHSGRAVALELLRHILFQALASRASPCGPVLRRPLCRKVSGTRPHWPDTKSRGRTKASSVLQRRVADCSSLLPSAPLLSLRGAPPKSGCTMGVLGPGARPGREREDSHGNVEAACRLSVDMVILDITVLGPGTSAMVKRLAGATVSKPAMSS